MRTFFLQQTAGDTQNEAYAAINAAATEAVVQNSPAKAPMQWRSKVG